MGETYKISAHLKGVSGNITWSGGNANVATVSNNGLVTAASNITNSTEEVTITASAEGCESKQCRVTVKKVVVPKIGDVVSYSPHGTFNWQAKYVSNNLAETDTNGDGIADKDVLLASGTSYSNLSDAEKAKYDSTQDMSITTWKILRKYQENGVKKVDMVPTASVGSLRLQGAQGYNNAVKMLDGACSNLYSTGSTITARSIKEEDYVKAGKQSQEGDDETTNDWTRFRNGLSVQGLTAYGTRLENAYSKAKSWYPNIYALEIGNGLNNDGTLGISEQTGNLIERKINNVENTKFQADDGIRPLQTYYVMPSGHIKEKLSAATGNVLVPQNNSNMFWVSSRSVLIDAEMCIFGLFTRTVIV